MDISQEVLSNIVIFNKYAKHLPKVGRRETWEEICDRNKAMHILKYPMLTDEINSVYANFVVNKKVLPSMRSMQFAGRPIELSNSRLFNCAFSNVDNPAVFWETMWNLLNGSGCGYSVQLHHIDQLPKVQGPGVKTRRFLVGDSIEGWADAIRVLMKAYFEGKSNPLLDYRDIRQKGSLLVTSGGKAPGPDPLRICVEKIRSVLNDAIGRKLNSLEIHDIMCHIADAVLSGGIRRAAMIVLFDKKDLDMLYCKTGPWWELNPQRGRANNSVLLKRGDVSKHEFDNIWEVVKNSGAGEPGIIWTDDLDSGLNPCCVSGDTNVLVCDSLDSVPYEIKMLDLVESFKTDVGPKYAVSYNVNSGKTEIKPIINACATRPDADLIELELSSGVLLKLTPDHKVFTVNRGYIQAAELVENDQLLTSNRCICIKRISLVSNEDTYDVEVEDNHNFFANNLLVHNSEIGLRSNQFCNLTEMNVSDISSQEELNNIAKAAAFIGTLQAGYTDFHYLRDIWKQNSEEEALIGVGMTGICSGEILKYSLVDAANSVLAENERVSSIIGINKAARTTCIKPSGSCVTPDTTIKTNKGLLTMEEIFLINGYDYAKMEPGFAKTHEDIFVYDSNNDPKLVTKLFNNGQKEIFEIKFEDNYILKCTANHRLLTVDGWKRADELHENDDIVSF